MAVLKVRCPDCDASIRQSVDPVDEPTDLKLKCPKCGHKFSATAEPEDQPAAKPKKVAKSATKDEATKAPRKKIIVVDEDDDDDDKPRRKKKRAKEEPEKSKLPLIAGGIAALLLVVGAITAGVMLGGSRDKKVTEVARGDTPATPDKPSVPAANPGPGRPKVDRPGKQPGGTTSSSSPASTTTTTQPSAPTEPALPPGVKLPPLPPKPKLRLNATEDQLGGRIESSGETLTYVSVPLAPEEDPFLRARGYRIEGALPAVPKLPPAKQRPTLALDSGGHTDSIRHVFFTPKDDKVITVAEDKTVRVWDIKTATSINTIRFPAGPGSEGALQAAALSSSGRLAVSGAPISLPPGTKPPPGTTPNVIFLVNIETEALTKALYAVDEVRSLHFSSDGNRLAAGCANGVTQVFSVTSGVQISRVEPQPFLHEGKPVVARVRVVRFHPDPTSQALAILNSVGQVRVVDLKSPSKGGTFSVGDVKAISIAWSNDGQKIAAGGHTGDIRLFDLSNPNNVRTIPKRTIKGHLVQFNQLQFMPNDASLLCGGSPASAAVITLEGKVKAEITAHTEVVTAVGIAPSGRLVASCGGDQNEIYVWNPTNGKVVARLAGRGRGVTAIGWSQDGKSIGWGTSKKFEEMDDSRNLPLQYRFRLDDLGPGGPAFTTKFQQAQKDDGTYSAVWKPAEPEPGRPPSIQLSFQATNGKEAQLHLVNLIGDYVYSVSILPGRGKAVIGGGSAIYTYDLQNHEIKELSGATGITFAVAPSPDGKYFVTGSSDQTIRIWRPELDEPILSIFTAGRDWIAWTPEGYYACSPHGEKLLAWQVNSGHNRMPQVFPADRFRPSMYQPAILKYLVPAGTSQFAMAMAQKYDKALVQTGSVADIVPPEASLDESIAENLQIDADNFTVKAHAKGTAKQPITSMRLLVDGRPFQGKAGAKRFDAPGQTGDATWNVPLTPGPHTFAVIAETPVSKGMCKPVTVVRKGEVPKPNLYVLAVGISAYDGKLAVRYAGPDATKLGNALQKHCKEVFGTIEVRIVRDRLATKKAIQEGMDWLASKMTAKDVGIVMFSGHGTRDEQNRFCLVPVDINSQNVAQSCLSGEEFKSRLDAMPGRLVALLNACNSGDVVEKVPPASTDSLAHELSSDDSGVIVMSASLGRENAYDGFFAIGLVEGLEGAADVDEDGVITIAELDMYAYARVRQLSEGRQNTTTSIPAGVRPFPIAIVPKKE